MSSCFPSENAAPQAGPRHLRRAVGVAAEIPPEVRGVRAQTPQEEAALPGPVKFSGGPFSGSLRTAALFQKRMELKL